MLGNLTFGTCFIISKQSNENEDSQLVVFISCYQKNAFKVSKKLLFPIYDSCDVGEEAMKRVKSK